MKVYFAQTFTGTLKWIFSGFNTASRWSSHMARTILLYTSQKNKVRVRGFVKNSLVYTVYTFGPYNFFLSPTFKKINKHSVLFKFVLINGILYFRLLFILTQLDTQPASKSVNYSNNQWDKLSMTDAFTFSRDVNLAHILSSVITDDGLINSCSLQWKLEKKQNKHEQIVKSALLWLVKSCYMVS